ncbi:hypothetical protein K7432_018575, partial [Basidiobolus ranarum]
FVVARLMDQHLRSKNLEKESEEVALFGAGKHSFGKYKGYKRRKPGLCYGCNKPGHQIKDCKLRNCNKNEKSEQANQVSTKEEVLFISALSVTSEQD